MVSPSDADRYIDTHRHTDTQTDRQAHGTPGSELAAGQRGRERKKKVGKKTEKEERRQQRRDSEKSEDRSEM